MESQMIQLRVEIDPLSKDKLDISSFNEYMAKSTLEYKKLCSQVDTMTSDVETTSNFVEKYLPMHLQRSLTHVLAFVFPGRDTAWRLNWYNELRMPMLSAALLTDEGKHNLKKKMQELVTLL